MPCVPVQWKMMKLCIIKIFFQKMRIKLDPQAEKKNKELFMLARRGQNESIMRFVDRLRMYIRRWGGDPRGEFAIEMLKYKGRAIL